MNHYKADLFVTIHCNAALAKSARGPETFCYGEGTDGESLAYCIQWQIIDNLGTVDRGVKYSKELYVLRRTDCPAVLVETAFISNAEDEKMLTEKQAEFAHAIARGFTDYFA